MAEVGVYRGDFAKVMLQQCDGLTRYYMIDPWKHLSGWNKPANQDDAVFGQFFQEAKEKTDFAAAKRVVLRGKTTEVIDQIPDGELDLAYIDADHTLKGIAIDLIRVYPRCAMEVLSPGMISALPFGSAKQVLSPPSCFRLPCTLPRLSARRFTPCPTPSSVCKKRLRPNLPLSI